MRWQRLFGGQGPGMIGAQDPLAPARMLLKQRDGLGGPARRLVGRDQVVPGGQGRGWSAVSRRSRRGEDQLQPVDRG